MKSEHMMALLSLLLLAAAAALAAPESHKIKSLPTMGDLVTFAQYSGHVDVAPTRSLFYWFVESQRSPQTDPVVLWLNGGPGSSSLLGFFVEHGPFRPTPNATLELNPYAWNRVANVIYLEAPASVGFSKVLGASDLSTGDQQTAEDNYQFLVNWIKLFPEFKKNMFYISGESYAGHYVPDLMVQILHKDPRHEVINIAGMLVGNAATNTDWSQPPGLDLPGDSWNYMTFLYSHGMLPHAAYMATVKACGWEKYLESCEDKWKDVSQECLDAIRICVDDYLPRDEFDVYNINAPVCIDPHYTSKWSSLAKRALKFRAKRDTKFDPCLMDYVSPYLNRADVQEAIHAGRVLWTPFSPFLNYSQDDYHSNKIPLYPEIFRLAKPALRVLLYSGDFDADVPFLNTQKWIACLGRPVRNAWRTWKIDGQVAGGIIEYDKISFLTVKGAGHMVPYYTPQPGFELFKRWIDEEPL